MVMKKNSAPGREEGDFYVEDGLVVFTRSYHLRRGYCCRQGCRHCPYQDNGPDEPKDPKTKNREP
jgi:hypothetical protein